jgi:hypothetical protein
VQAPRRSLRRGLARSHHVKRCYPARTLGMIDAGRVRNWTSSGTMANRNATKDYMLWIEEPDKNVWHGSVEWLQRWRVRAGCGWELDARQGRIWPVKSYEPGPPAEDRCHACVGAKQDRCCQPGAY